jgi:hypothetical protein
MYENTDGITIKVSNVELTTPPITAAPSDVR